MAHSVHTGGRTVPIRSRNPEERSTDLSGQRSQYLDWVVLGCRFIDASPRGPESSNDSHYWGNTPSPPALVLVVVLGLPILIDNPPLTISELALFELEALILWVGLLVVVLFIDYRRKHG